MRFFTCEWGMWTNGEVIIFMVKTGANELTCSHPVPWESPNVFWAIVGFTLASIDSKTDPALRNAIVGHRHSVWPGRDQLLQNL